MFKQRPYNSLSYNLAILKSIINDNFSYEFENDTPFNFRSFIGMVHVNDGMIAITSDAIAYLLKFNYD